MGVPPIGLIVPLGTRDDQRAIARLVERGAINSVWVRDLPVVPVGDGDAGQGNDPWWHLGRLLGAGVVPRNVGTASVILGTRHPLVTARAATGAQIETGGRFVLGVGTGGKAEMNRALGVAGRSLVEFAAEWTQLRAALTGTVSPATSMNLPVAYCPPPMYLATNDLTRWEAIGGDADGWQTFLTDDHDRFRRDLRRVDAIRGARTDVDVRLDVTLIGADAATPKPQFTDPSRGRVRCTAQQLPGLILPWITGPIGRILLRLSGPEPEEALLHLADQWSS